MHKTESTRTTQLDSLLEIFYSFEQRPGIFHPVDSDQLTSDAAELLAHDHHMTVTLEKFHGCPVDVHVLDSTSTGDHYSRKSLLTRQSDDAVVQLGIVRLDRKVLTSAVLSEIESQRTPLGRVLIQHNVLRSVKLRNLFRIDSAGELSDRFKVAAGTECFGRTAVIFCDGKPGIELLEIVNTHLSR